MVYARHTEYVSMVYIEYISWTQTYPGWGQSNSGKGGGHYSSERDKDRNQGLCCSYCPDSLTSHPHFLLTGGNK